jgi:hypothetical protein
MQTFEQTFALPMTARVHCLLALTDKLFDQLKMRSVIFREELA